MGFFMNSKLRIASLALSLGLAGMVTLAWGAESVINLISQGDVAIKNLKASKVAYENGLTQNKALADEAKQISVDNQKLSAAIDDYKKQSAGVKQQIDAYSAKCSGKKLDRKTYDECKAEQPKVSSAVDAVNAIPAKLNKQQSDLVARSNQYNKNMQDLQASAPKLQKDYNEKLTTDESWLNQVRNFAASPAVQPYAKKAGCPDTNKIAKNVGQVIDQSEQYLACLKKIAGTG